MIRVDHVEPPCSSCPAAQVRCCPPQRASRTERNAGRGGGPIGPTSRHTTWWTRGLTPGPPGPCAAAQRGCAAGSQWCGVCASALVGSGGRRVPGGGRG
ncbi:hypothetical protein SFR_5238 [Streptomyces sp. FR-008]|nr:hypothetical protein SFR_5238 [Streptomyces sp. FR-008]